MSYNFDKKGRVPVRPLSFEHIDQAVPKEFVIDYTKCTAYIVDENGDYYNVFASPEVLDNLVQHITEKPEIITNVKIIKTTDEGDEEITLQASLSEIYEMLKPENLASNHTHDYYPSTGGKLNGDVILPNGKGVIGDNGNSENTMMIYVGEDGNIHLGYSNQDAKIILDNTLILSSKNYGTVLPDDKDGTEGQIFLKIIEDEA